MNKDQVLQGMYEYLITNLPQESIDLIVDNDIRVENFFAIYSGVYLKILFQKKEIQNFSFQHTILMPSRGRVHIDIVFEDSDNVVTYLELKHFSISQNRSKVRSLPFYISNSKEGKQVGIVGDCEKLDTLRQSGFIERNVNLVCCAFITHLPTKEQYESMISRLETYQETRNWQKVLPVSFENQSRNIGFFTLQN